VRARYGASPWHLAGHLLLAGVAGYALSRMLQVRVTREPLNLLAWLVGGALVHDFLLLPAYATFDAGVRRALAADRRRAVPLVNHVRVPAALSGVLLLVYAPRIFDRQPRNVVNSLGHPAPDYLARWAAVTAALVAGSALVYAFRAARAAGRRSPAR